LAHAELLFAAFPQQRQALGAVEAEDLLVIDDVAFSAQEDREPSITETRPLLSQFAQLLPDLFVSRSPGFCTARWIARARRDCSSSSGSCGILPS
jgi:hypothetical protein